MYLYKGETPIKIYRGKYDIPKIYKGETLLCDENINIEPWEKITQIIVNGDFSNGSSGWSGVTTSASIVDGKLYNNGANTSQKLVYQVGVLSPSSIIYASADYELISGNIRLISSLVTPLSTPGIGRMSWLIRVSTANAIIMFGIGTVAYLDNVIFINLTAAFGAGNEPTKAEMDNWFNGVGYFEGSKMF